MPAPELVDTMAVWLAHGLVSAARTDSWSPYGPQAGWQNRTTGMGTWRDKTRQTFYGGGYDLAPQELEDLYSHEDVAGRGVDLVPDECFRPGYRLESEDEGLLKDFAAQSETHGLREKLIEADCFGRLHGGALLVFGTDDGNGSAEPLRPTPNGTDWLEVLDCRYFSVLNWYGTGPKSGQPELYAIGNPGPIGFTNPQTRFVVHESRTVRFGGARTTRTEKLRRGWRDHSVLQRPYDVIRKFATGFEAVGQLLSDGPQGVWSIDGLRDLISAHGTAAIEARVELIDRMRSFVHGIMVDGKGEKFERQQVPFTGIPDILDRLMLRMAAAFGEPMVQLFGMSPAGFSTGDTDVRIWNNKLATRQENYLTPRILEVTRKLLGLDPDPSASEFEVCWGNLWEQTEAEAADTRLKLVQADKLDFDMGVREPEEIFLDREDWPSQLGWNPDDEAVALRKELRDISSRKAIEDANNPPEPPGTAGAPGTAGQVPPADPSAAVRPGNEGAVPGPVRSPAPG